MCPQFSLQVMMGIGTPTAWQVNVTVEPLAASTASSGGLVTEGGAARHQHRRQSKHNAAGEGLGASDPVGTRKRQLDVRGRHNSLATDGRLSSSPRQWMPHKKALCLSQHMCEKSLASQKIRNSVQRNAEGDRRQEWTKVEKKKAGEGGECA